MRIFIVAPTPVNDIFDIDGQLIPQVVAKFSEQMTASNVIEVGYTSLEEVKQHFNHSAGVKPPECDQFLIYEYEYNGTIYKAKDGRMVLSKPLPGYDMENVYRAQLAGDSSISLEKFSVKALWISNDVFAAANDFFIHFNQFFNSHMTQPLTVDTPLVMIHCPDEFMQRLESATGVSDNVMIGCFLENFAYDYTLEANKKNNSVSRITLPLDNFIVPINQGQFDNAMTSAFLEWLDHLEKIYAKSKLPKELFIIQFLEKIKLFPSVQLIKIIEIIKNRANSQFITTLKEFFVKLRKNAGTEKNLIISCNHNSHEFKFDIGDLSGEQFNLLAKSSLTEKATNITNAWPLTFSNPVSSPAKKEGLLVQVLSSFEGLNSVKWF